ncbi:MAG: response regulator [Treponema sp.]|jgi:putative two-component system response regulator|nr:response regulator [Treponema sp.]
MKHILVVDDNLTSLKQIKTLLAQHYEVSLAKSGVQALQICLHERPDLILLDVEMPEMDGFETIERLKKIPTLKRIPLVFLTVNREPSVQIRGLELGARDYIIKPVAKNILLHRIELQLRFASFQSHLEHMVMKMSDMIATSLAELIECRDENTGGHVIRTSAYVDHIGRGLLEKNLFSEELTGAELDMMVRAAPLHDIGKIVISDRILLKNGQLDENEFEDMKRHAAIGAEILEKIYSRTPSQHYLKYAIMIAHSHHERYDGAGYPLGLKGNEIPLCGRIMAVADVYDALTHDRVYHKGKTHEEAYRLIMKDKGTHFDPLVLNVFEDIHERMAADTMFMEIPDIQSNGDYR